MTSIERTPKSEQMQKALALLSRATFDVKPVLYATGEGDESGGALTPEVRNELLKKLAAGEYVAVDVDLSPAFEQQAGVSNRNFVRFRDQSLLAMGRTGIGRPFLRDHAQWNQMAVAGRIIASRTTKLADGHYQIHQRARLTATWAVDLALRDLLHAVSIGWEPTGPVECSVCNADIRRDGYVCHWPGMKVAEMTGADGKKKYVYDRSSKLVVEWIYTDAELIETSMCPIGGVRTAGIGVVRAALAAAGIEIPDDESLAINPALAAVETDSTPVAPPPQRVLTTEQSMSDKKPEALTGTLAVVEPEIVVLSDKQHAHYQKLGTTDREKFIAKTSVERDAEIAAALAADPVEYTGKRDGRVYRKSEAALAALARDNDMLHEQNTAERAARQAEQLAARAKTTLAGMHGADEVHVAILGAVEAIADEPTRKLALQSLTAWRNQALAGGLSEKAPGVNPETPVQGQSLAAQFETGWKAYQAANKCSDSDARLAYVKTPEGRALYNALSRAELPQAQA